MVNIKNFVVEVVRDEGCLVSEVMDCRGIMMEAENIERLKELTESALRDGLISLREEGYVLPNPKYKPKEGKEYFEIKIDYDEL